MLPSERFTNDGLKHSRCRTCARAIVEKSIYGSEARRLLARVRAYCRVRRMPEGACWRLKDVEALIEQSELPDFKSLARLRIIRRDTLKPFLPQNAMVVCFGMGL